MYLPQADRDELEPRSSQSAMDALELAYQITCLVDGYLVEGAGLNTHAVNEVMGALECVKLEVYRRLAAPLADQQIAAHGDLYVTELPSDPEHH